MSNFLVYLDASDVRPGKLNELKAAMEDLTRFVEATEPRIVAYNVYFSAAGTRMNVLHIHPDAASLEFHMEILGPRLPPIAPFVTLRTIEIFGTVNNGLMQRLEAKTKLLGGSVIIHDHHAGFARGPSA